MKSSGGVALFPGISRTVGAAALPIALALASLLPAEPARSALPALRAEGTHIVDPSGKPVLLRGVNIGGWLVPEGWMCGQFGDTDRLLLDRLEARFGQETAGRLMNLWFDNWITTADLDLIAEWGFNLLRVPFSWRNLQNVNGEWIRKPDGSIDFSRFDWVVEEAAGRGIYVIFDLHQWPGEYGEISRHTEEGARIRAQMAELWKEIARHFKGNTNIAGFDVINEPEGSPGDLPHRAFYDAIRSEDPGRMLLMVWSAVRYWQTYGWTNVVVSDHYPESEIPDIAPGEIGQRLTAFEEKHRGISAQHFDYPQLVGETKAPEDTEQSARDLVAEFEKRGWSWAVWTYKGVNVGGWAGFNYYAALRFDPDSIPVEELEELWGNALIRWQDPLATKNYYLTQWWIDGFAPARR